MHFQTLALFALSASTVVASPFHRRAHFTHNHHRMHGTGPAGSSSTGTGALFPAGNDTEGTFAPTGDAAAQPVTLVITKTVSPLPADSDVNTFGNVASDVKASSSCVTTSIATEVSTNFVTVTAAMGDLAAGKAVEVSSVSAGEFYGGHGSRSWGGGGWGNTPSSDAANPITSLLPSGLLPSAGQPSTTLATVPSASKSSGGNPSASAPASGSSGSKRGISFNDASLVSAFSGSVSWAYNWGATASGLNGVEFVPMMWGTDNVNGFANNVGSATHVLSFNEPDLGEQSNIDPQTAASLHKQAMAGLVGKVQIGSPAVTNGGSTSPPMGVNWLDQFFTACGTDCPVDFVAYHWYATADSIEYFKSHTQDIINVAKKHGVDKVWLTEFAPQGSADAQAAFMSEAVKFLESTPAVERYAAFMASDDTLLSGGSLNSVGSAYIAA